jgi:hypothetical protein
MIGVAKRIRNSDAEPPKPPAGAATTRRRAISPLGRPKSHAPDSRLRQFQPLPKKTAICGGRLLRLMAEQMLDQVAHWRRAAER